MSSLTQTTELANSVRAKMGEIQTHLAWHGDLTGSEAEAILRNKPDKTYLLRQGEKSDHFYLTYVQAETTFVHIPFIIDQAIQKWFYRNYHPHFGDSLQTFIPEIMHVEEATCFPLSPFVRA